jgi:hypothetical protein
MKKTYLVALFAVLLTVQAQAQVETETLAGEVDQQIDQLSGTQTMKPQQTQSVVTQTVVVPQQQQVQKQPTTLIEASPLADSRADSIRRNRQDEEMKTESKIVEKLEQSRMEDEKRRAQVLFGDKFDTLQNGSQQPQVVAPVAAPAPVQVAPSSQIQAQPIIIEQSDSLSKDDVREEIRAALEEQEEEIVAPVQQKYFAGVAGIANYPDAKTIQGNYSLGASFGTRYDLFMVEGTFLFSNYTVAGVDYYSTGVSGGSIYYPRTISDQFNMNQYQGIISAKYQLLDGFVRPYLGGLMSYSYRTYESNFTTYRPLDGSYIYKGDTVATSHSIDLGTDVGVDLEFNDRISIGANFKYLFNLSSRINGDTAGEGTAVEKQQYFITGLTARVNF